MGHGKIRSDNTCLNCGSVVRQRFCSNCGQENVEVKESLAHIASHFIADITHFDGKFFSTCKYLVANPGFLPKEYMEGRRVQYLHPIRMYVFTSALFFLIFFSVFTVKELDDDANVARPRVQSSISGIEGRSGTPDSLGKSQESSADIIVTDDGYSSVRQYDSIQRTLPTAQRDNWIQRRINIRKIEITTRYQSNPTLLIKVLMNKFIHTFPTLLFISLPLFALYLNLLYRRKKHLYYADHAVFLIYLYIFSFLALLALIGNNKLRQAISWSWLDWIGIFIVLYGVYYAFTAMRRFYGGSFGKTVLKFFVFNVIAGTTLLMLFGIFFVLSVFRI